MDFFEVVKKRRSVRKYTSKPVPPEVIKKALDAALIAPTSSNLQQWEFYWVRNPAKKAKLAEACVSQNAATTAQELIVAVSRIDTWKKHAALVLADAGKSEKPNPQLQFYYTKLIPMLYQQDPFGILATLRWFVLNIIGLFRPSPRGAHFQSEFFEIATKTTALACENFILAITAQGYATCPMEGFDRCRVRKIIGLQGKAHIVMVISVGEADPAGIYGEQYRVPSKMVVHELN